MKPICVPCQRFFRPIQIGFHFLEGMPIGDSGLALPGKQTPENWKPYKLWEGDKWRCEGCGAEIISGVAQEPIAEHYEPRFEALRQMFDAHFQVNDC